MTLHSFNMESGPVYIAASSTAAALDVLESLGYDIDEDVTGEILGQVHIADESADDPIDYPALQQMYGDAQ